MNDQFYQAFSEFWQHCCFHITTVMFPKCIITFTARKEGEEAWKLLPFWQWIVIHVPHWASSSHCLGSQGNQQKDMISPELRSQGKWSGIWRLPRVQRAIAKGFAKERYFSVSVQIKSTFRFYFNCSFSSMIHWIIKVIISEMITRFVMYVSMYKAVYCASWTVCNMTGPSSTEP